MTHSLKSVQKHLSKIQKFMQRVEQKDSTLSAQEYDLTPYRIMHDLRSCVPAFLIHPKALELLFEVAPKIEAYRGKGTQIFNDEFLQILHGIELCGEHDFFGNKKIAALSTEENKTLAYQKIAHFAFIRAKGNGKPIRSRRAADLRNGYWDLLSDLAPNFQVPEALELARATAKNAKASLPERSGAISYLFAHLDVLGDTGDGKQDPETSDIIGDLRNNPPSRDILFLILDAGVNAGQIDEMSALFDLEDWDEKNDH